MAFINQKWFYPIFTHLLQPNSLNQFIIIVISQKSLNCTIYKILQICSFQKEKTQIIINKQKVSNITKQTQQMKLLHHFGMFLLGIRDSVSLGWIPNILFYVDRRTRQIHPQSKNLLTCLKSSTMQVMLFIFGLPAILYILGLQYLALALKGLFLLLSYGYFFFYNQQILRSTRSIIRWKQSLYPNTNFELDSQLNIRLIDSISGQIKGIIFLIFYYLPILTLTTLFSFIPYFGMAVMVLSEAFFSATFFFLSTWPYDKYNVAFLELNFAYLTGFGMFISILGNYLLTGITSLGICMLFSLWMLINSVLYSPVQTQFTSFSQIWSVLTSYKSRNGLPNAYNVHRRRITTQRPYRKHLMNNTIYFLNPALKITHRVTGIIANFFNQRNLDEQSPQRERQNENNNDQNHQQ